MKKSTKKLLVAGMTALALCVPLTACGGSSSGNSDSGASTEAAEPTGASDEAKEFFTGQWRGSVEITGQTVDGAIGGNEQMLDVNFADDGTVTVVPLEADADLLNAAGTYEGDPKASVTLHLEDRDITLIVVDQVTLQGTASDFNIDGFDTINLDFYG